MPKDKPLSKKDLNARKTSDRISVYSNVVGIRKIQKAFKDPRLVWFTEAQP